MSWHTRLLLAGGVLTALLVLLELTVGDRWFSAVARYTRRQFMWCLVGAMAVCLGLSLLTGWSWLYYATGAIWGITFPLRQFVRQELARQTLGDPLKGWFAWAIAMVLTLVYTFVWPVALPLMYALKRTVFDRLSN